MASAESATEAAAFVTLSAGVTLATVYQHVPEDTNPPVVIVADMSTDAAKHSSKESVRQDCQIELTIASVFKGEARAPILAIEEEVLAALHQHRETRSNWQLTFIYDSSDGSLLEDGETYVNNIKFKVFAFSTT